MISLRRAEQRRHEDGLEGELWLTFDTERTTDRRIGSLGMLRMLNEERLRPGGVARVHARREAEIITYVREGGLTYEDSTGASGVICAGEVQRMTAGRGVRHSEVNASLTEQAHFFQIWLRPSEAELLPSRERKRFSAAERRDGLCVIASPDARRGSLRLHPNALLYSAILDPGKHIVHELSPRRGAWLHIVEGEVTFAELVLTTGDGVGLTNERAVSFTAREETEVLLLDLSVIPPGSPRVPAVTKSQC